MILLSGGDLVLPDRILASGHVLIADSRIAAISATAPDAPTARRIDISGHLVVPGFVDLHVHGVLGHDVLDGPSAVASIAAALPRFGVTAFCPTSVACTPADLRMLLESVAAAREAAVPGAARVLPAHLESNFINPDWKGAQPQACLRHVPAAPHANVDRRAVDAMRTAFDGTDILDVIATHRSAVAIVTLAPELPNGLDLVRELTAAGHIVSIGHSGATYEEARAAIAAGVRHATHLFNRMSGLTARAPGVVGAVLASTQVVAELICDGYHVHPALVRWAVETMTPARIMAITDGTSGSGLPVGSRARLGEQSIIVTARTAELADGTLAGSVLTMDGAFRMLVHQARLSPIVAAQLCATTPAAQLGVADTGRLVVGARADIAVLDRALRVTATYVAGHVALEPH